MATSSARRRGYPPGGPATLTSSPPPSCSSPARRPGTSRRRRSWSTAGSRRCSSRVRRSQLLAPPLDRHDPKRDRERSAVELLGELGDRDHALHELVLVQR